MSTFLNRGYEAFERAANSRIYIDKTDMLDVLNSYVNTEQSCVCMTRPRRFGKTMTANMLMAYYGKGCDSRFLFENRKLGRCPGWDRYLNQFDVIRFDMAGIRSRVDSPEQTLPLLFDDLYIDLTDAYPDIKLDREKDVANWLNKISMETGTRFVIIIDEWDCLFRDEQKQFRIQEQYVRFLRSLFKNSDSGRFLALGYMTGILPIKQYQSESALNNFDEYTTSSDLPVAFFSILSARPDLKAKPPAAVAAVRQPELWLRESWNTIWQPRSGFL